LAKGELMSYGVTSEVADGAQLMRNGALRRRAIIAAAVDVFAELGYDGASLREVAAASGMEKGHLTYYFPSKDDLLFEILTDLQDQFLKGLSSWAKEGDGGLPGLQVVMFRHVELTCALYKQTRVTYESIRFLPTKRRVAVMRKRTQYEKRLGELIDNCRDTGEIADLPTALLTKIVLGLLNWVYQWYEPSGEHSADDLAHMISQRGMAAVRTG
jgi:TetR/AcrR family transcriptional regulator, cholesterol catabolism regulator